MLSIRYINYNPKPKTRVYSFSLPFSLSLSLSKAKIPSAVVATVGAISIARTAVHKGRFAERVRRVLVPDLRGRLTRDPAETGQSLNWIIATRNIGMFDGVAAKRQHYAKTRCDDRPCCFVSDSSFLMKRNKSKVWMRDDCISFSFLHR